MAWQHVWRERPLRPLLLILLLAFALRLVGLANQSLWWDELKTIDRRFSGVCLTLDEADK